MTISNSSFIKDKNRAQIFSLSSKISFFSTYLRSQLAVFETASYSNVSSLFCHCEGQESGLSNVKFDEEIQLAKAEKWVKILFLWMGRNVKLTRDPHHRPWIDSSLVFWGFFIAWFIRLQTDFVYVSVFVCICVSVCDSAVEWTWCILSWSNPVYRRVLQEFTVIIIMWVSRRNIIISLSEHVFQYILATGYSCVLT